jgi:carbonic anhydrase
MGWIVMRSPKTFAQKQIKDFSIAENVLGIRKLNLPFIIKNSLKHRGFF